MKIMPWALLLAFSVGMACADGTSKSAASPIMAMCILSPASDSQVKGWVKFTQMKNYVKIEGEITGLTPGEHGFHVHENGDCSAPDAISAGGHFNPTHKAHGGPVSKERHVGDLGNIVADKNGTARVNFRDGIIRLSGEYSILGRSIIVHGDRDDLKSQPAGNAGKRVACGVIQLMK